MDVSWWFHLWQLQFIRSMLYQQFIRSMLFHMDIIPFHKHVLFYGWQCFSGLIYNMLETSLECLLDCFTTMHNIYITFTWNLINCFLVLSNFSCVFNFTLGLQIRGLNQLVMYKSDEYVVCWYATYHILIWLKVLPIDIVRKHTGTLHHMNSSWNITSHYIPISIDRNRSFLYWVLNGKYWINKPTNNS